MALPTCSLCGHAHEDNPGALECVLSLKTTIRNILTRVADRPPIPCEGKARGGTCDVVVYMIRHANGAWTPYTETGVNHFANCPDRELFRRPKK